MKISSLFDLLTDARDVLDFFDGVNTKEQLVSRLERLKRQVTDDMMECIDGLRSSVTKTLEDTLEMSAVLDEPEEEADPELDKLLDKIADESDESDKPEEDNPAETPAGEETQNPPEPVKSENAKSVQSPE